MKNKLRNIPAAVILLLVMVSTGMGQTELPITEATILSSAGGRCQSQSFMAAYTVGQPIIGTTSGTDFQMGLGFWAAQLAGITTDTGGDRGGSLPLTFRLETNYPNPFNPSTTIAYTVPEKASVKLSVYNILGQVVAVLVDKEQLAGHYEVTWNGCSDGGYPTATGVYFYRLTAGDHRDTKKMLLLK